MTTKGFKQYQGLSKDKVLKFKLNGEFIYARPQGIGGITAPMPTPEVNENIGYFLKIKDIEVYKNNPAQLDNYQNFTATTNQIESDIEIINL
jgi:hypothetical protein